MRRSFCSLVLLPLLSLSLVACGDDGPDPNGIGVNGSLAGVSGSVDTDGDGTPDIYEGSGDWDGDGVPDHLDADSVGLGEGATLTSREQLDPSPAASSGGTGGGSGGGGSGSGTSSGSTGARVETDAGGADAAADAAQGADCGSATCGTDEFCCNESCGICAPKDGGFCTEQACVDAGADAGAPGVCATVKCGNGKHCEEFDELVCIAPPCDPIARCVADCGCPANQVCCEPDSLCLDRTIACP